MKLSSKPIFMVCLFLLGLSGISLILDHPGFALRLETIAFWILCLAIAYYIWETKNDQ